MFNEKEKRDSALLAIPTPTTREPWLKIGMAFKAAGGEFETWDIWSQRGSNYNARSARDVWNSITAGGGVTDATLYKEARANGWTPPREEYCSTNRRAVDRKKPPKQQATEMAIPAGQKKKIKDYITDAISHRAEIMDYCKQRGLSEETIEDFNLGYDPNSKRLIIPYPTVEYYAARDMAIAPNETNKDQKAQKYLFPTKEQAGERPLFNIPALTNGAETVFITEGQIDAISLEQYGGAAIASNTPGIVLKALEAAGDALTVKQFLIIPDNDRDPQGNPDPEKGEKTAVKMQESLTAAGYTAYIYKLPQEYHDTNDMTVRSSPDLWEWIRQGENFIEENRRQALEQYKKTTGAARLADLEEIIKRNATREAIKTGYPTLDNSLGDKCFSGGLYPGLYFIGAISSLGKTTFALQMADQIAATGQDVLIFSLEMSAIELMAKSISRLTYHTAGEDRDRKTTWGILAGTRYSHYRPAELEAITKAKEQYKEIAEHLYITEALGNIGVSDIRETVKEHYKITGRRPVVFIDYLQILAPEDTKATEKQNTDRAVVELKRISRDYDIPVIAISSFNRENYKNEVSESAYKESGAIEYSSDVLIGLQLKGAGSKEFNTRTEKAKNPRKVELHIIKNRNGAVYKDPIEFDFYPHFNYFEDVNNGHTMPAEYAQFPESTAKGKRM